MIKLIVFNDGNVTFDYNETGLDSLTDQQKYIESIFGTMADEEAIDNVKAKYPELTEEQILNDLKLIFASAYQEIMPGFLEQMKQANPNIPIAIATEHTKYVSDYLKDYVDQYYISNEMGFDKNNPLFFQTIINRSGLNPRDILYVDYDIRNILVAKSVGMSVKQVEEKDLNLGDKVLHTQLGHRLIDSLINLKSTRETENNTHKL